MIHSMILVPYDINMAAILRFSGAFQEFWGDRCPPNRKNDYFALVVPCCNPVAELGRVELWKFLSVLGGGDKQVFLLVAPHDVVKQKKTRHCSRGAVHLRRASYGSRQSQASSLRETEEALDLACRPMENRLI